MIEQSEAGLPTTFFYPDGVGSTAYVADSAGNLIEKYTYDLAGTPTVYDPNGVIRPGGTLYDVTHLFTGQKWYGQLGILDLRNRAYLPDLGRFLQPDPIGFGGDANNLYRYCGNNPVNCSDPSGEGFQYTQNGNNLHFYLPVSYGLSPGVSATQISTLNSGIQQAWTGSFGPFSVTTTVVGPISGLTNYVQLTHGFFSSNSINIYIPGDINNPAAVAAHEAGHWMNLHNSTDLNDIMGNVTARPSEQDIRDILASGGNALLQGPLNEPSLNIVPSVQAGIAGALSALSAYGQAHGPGIGVVTVSGAHGSTVVAVGNVGGSFSFGGTTYSGGVAVSGLGGALVSTGGGGWQTWGGAGLYGGGQPGEGSHSVPYRLN